MSLDEEHIKLINAKNAYLAGCLDSWAIILVENPEMIKIIVKDMQKLADTLKKSAGVIFLKNGS